MKTKIFIAISILALYSVRIAAQSTSIDYFGQIPPGDKAVVFNPGVFSINNGFKGKIAFSPDGNEFFFSGAGNWLFKIYFTKRINGAWTSPSEAPFSVNRKVLSPFVSADGNRLYFTDINTVSWINKIYMVERNAFGEWGESKLLPSPINATNDGDYVETADGVGYLESNRPGSFDPYGDIWCIRRLADQSLKAESLGSVVNNSSQDSYPCLPPDGSFLIYSSTRSGGYGNQDLFICFNKGNSKWTAPVNMEKSGAGINISSMHQAYASLSPDGKYLFFTRHNSLATISDVCWVSTNIIAGLKKTVFAPKLGIQIPNITLKKDAPLNFIIPSNTFTCEYSADSLTYSASLKNGAALPSWLSFNAATRTLSGTPKQVAVDSIKITATNKDNVSATCTFKIEVSPATGIEKLKAQTIDIFPNPSSGVFNIHIGSTSVTNAKVEIYDFTGKMVLSNEYSKGVIDLTGYQNGIYVAKIMIGNEVFTKKLTIN